MVRCYRTYSEVVIPRPVSRTASTHGGVRIYQPENETPNAFGCFLHDQWLKAMGHADTSLYQVSARHL